MNPFVSAKLVVMILRPLSRNARDPLELTGYNFADIRAVTRFLRYFLCP